MIARPVKERTAYQVGRRIFATKLAAAKAEAWAIVLDEVMQNDQSRGAYRLSEIKKYNGIVCECDNSEYGQGSYCCGLHNRRTGLFREMHKNVVQKVLDEWEQVQP